MSESVVVDAESTVQDLLNKDCGMLSGSFVTVVSPNGGVAGGWLVIEPVDGADAVGGRRCAVIGPDPVMVVASGAPSEVALASWQPVPGMEMPAWAQVIAEGHWASERAWVAAHTAKGELAAEQDRMERIVDAAHEMANENSLCTVFDRFMIEQGLRPRSHDYDITVDVRVRVRLTQGGYDADSACENVSTSLLGQALYNLSSFDTEDQIEGFDIVDVDRV